MGKDCSQGKLQNLKNTTFTILLYFLKILSEFPFSKNKSENVFANIYF
jgi:hypothetical protein